MGEKGPGAYSNSNALSWWRCLVRLMIRHCHSTGVVGRKLIASFRVRIIRGARAAW